MSDTQTLDHNVSKATFWSAIVLILAGILSVFFPLDAPEGPFADRMMWYSNNVGAFVLGWVVQMIAMLTLSGVFAGTAWQTRNTAPVASFLAGVALLFATMAFLVPKFIAIWSIPQMVTASTTVTANAAVAERLFQLLNPTVPYTLFASFDYLGFWMYGVFGLLVARPLIGLSMSARISGICLGLYGLLYHLLFVGVMSGSVATADIGVYSGSLGLLLLVPVISMAVFFKGQLKDESGD